MKRYMAFMGYNYYPNGGIEDLVGFCDTIEDCISAFNEKKKEEEDYKNIIPKISEKEFLEDEWYNRFAHVCDLQSNEIVWVKHHENQ